MEALADSTKTRRALHNIATFHTTTPTKIAVTH